MELLERDTQLAALNALFDEARQGKGRVALVSGEAGIGKTSLVRRFAADLPVSVRLLWGGCDAMLTPPPLGPIYDLAPAATPTFQARLNEGGDWLTIARALLAELQRRVAVVVIEDAHWADAATLDLLRFLGRRIDQTNALLILTFRNDELGPQHPLRLVLGDLASTGVLHRIALHGLSVEGVRVLAAGKAVDPEALHRQTYGNPFFVTEVLVGDGQGIPATVRDAVLARTARLSLSAQAALEAAAVIGARSEPWLLDQVVGAEAAAVEECLAVGALQAEGDRLAFRHELARQVVLDATSPSRVLALHRLVLAALEASPLTKSDLARLAHHAQGANDHQAVLAYAPEAARQAATADAHREAAAQYGRALRFAGGMAARPRALLLEAYAVECDVIDRMDEAIRALQEARRLWHELGDQTKEGKMLSLLAGCLVMTGQNAAAEESSRAAVDMLAGLPPSPEQAYAYRTQASLRMLHRDNAEAISWARKALALAQQLEETSILAYAYNTLGSALVVSGDSGGYQHLEQSLAIAREAGYTGGVALAYSNLGSGSGEMHDFARAEHYLAAGIAYCSEWEIEAHRRYMLAWQALTHLFRGRWDQAATAAAEIIGLPNVAAITRIMALVALARVRLRRGDPGVAATLNEAMDLALPTGTLQRLAPVRAARAEAAWLAGDRGGVRQEAAACYELALQKQHIWYTGELAFWLWRAGEPVSPPGWTARPFALQVAGQWRAAAAEWERLGCPYEQARALADGDTEAQLRALAMFEALGAAPAAAVLRQALHAAGTPGVPRGPRQATRHNPFGLTSRQMEVLLLLAEGLSNNDIAARLTISHRTVEHHVTATLAKLDVNSRQEAIALAWEHNLLSHKQ